VTVGDGPALGLSLGGAQSSGADLAEQAVLAEQLGYDTIWTSEAWGQDAFTPLAYMAAVTSTIGLGTAIAQISGRTPATTAMTALTIQGLSDGRLQLGLGVSGPQVVEGWHGVPFGKPLAKTREYVEVLRLAMAGDRRLEFQGTEFHIPYTGDGATGLGKPLRTTIRDARPAPILVAAIGPKNVALAVEVADGLLPYLWSPSRWEAAWGKALAEAKPEFSVAPTVLVAIDDDLDQARDRVRPRLALHIGGMGARGKNFYHSLVTRYGYQEEADVIQDLYLSGNRDGAFAAVTDALVDDLALVGPAGRVAEQLALWRSGPVTALIAEPQDRHSVEEFARIWHSGGRDLG
jgi:F420-dependent oxidoreductase-like protein